MPKAASPDPDFHVVLLGSGLGVYALARAFHEQYGVTSTVVGENPTAPMLHSRICTVKSIPEASSAECTIDQLASLAHPDKPTLLLANSDERIAFIAEHEEQLSEHFALRVPSKEAVEAVVDKALFAEVCERLDVPAPRTVVVDFRDGHEPTVPSLPFDYPIIAKPAKHEPHTCLEMPDKHKVYPLNSEAEFSDLLKRLHRAGFNDRLVAQEMIPGDDTMMRSITAYRDPNGTVTLFAGAQVLLEEHTPDALGRPAAMITTALPEQFEQTEQILAELDYVGFANADVKVDPRDGSARFLEINPRIGRNCHYVTAAGANVSRFLVEDVVHHNNVEPVVVTNEVLYSLVPNNLLRRYVTAPDLKSWVCEVADRGSVNPWQYSAEGWWMRAYARAVPLNHVRKFRRYYPEATDTGF